MHYRYLIKTCMDGAGGHSVAYLIGTNLLDNKVVDLSLDGIINLFQRVAAGLVSFFLMSIKESNEYLMLYIQLRRPCHERA